MTKTNRVDVINTGLILLSAALAFILPFKLFLLAYAVLGPLHYLTEINWLHGKDYFASKWTWLLIGVLVASVVVVPKLIEYFGLLDLPVLHQVAFGLHGLSNGVLFLAVWSSIVLVFIQDKKIRLGFIAVGCGVAYLIHQYSFFNVFFGLMIPTIIHVYLFTLLFMLYGTMKTDSFVGYINVGLMMVSVVVFLMIEPAISYSFSDTVKATFIENGFHITNIEIAKLLGLADGKTFLFYGDWELKLQRFMAFAYLYHYLNWFSKTAIIGWHKGITGKRFWAIISIWLSLIVLFLIDYRIGFYGALGFSFLHVVLELPLNVVSVKGIVENITGRFNLNN